MKTKDLLTILNNEFPEKLAFFFDGNKKIQDTVGLLIKGKNEVEKVLISLDITLDVIMQAIENEVDAIICHHPLYLGDRDEWLKKYKFDKAKFTLLEAQNINLIAIHTNADYNSNSIAFNIAKKLNLENIESHHNSQLISGEFKESLDSEGIRKTLEEKLSINYQTRNNLKPALFYKKVIICSGACGELIYNNLITGNIFMPGEIKYHHWTYAKEHNISVFELGHFSENIFKEIVEEYLNSKKLDLKIVLAIEENEY